MIALDGGPADLGDAGAAADSGAADSGASDGGARDLGSEPRDGGAVDAFRDLGSEPDASTAEICDNRADDDGDGQADCFDPDCDAHPACAPVDPEDCTNSVDDDMDGATDCDDGDCAGETTCGSISEPVLECLNFCVFEPEDQRPACHLACQTEMGVQGSRETDCTDGLDNDDDGLTDGDDADCA